MRFKPLPCARWFSAGIFFCAILPFSAVAQDALHVISPPVVTTSFGSPSVALTAPAQPAGSASVAGMVFDDLQNSVAGVTVTLNSDGVLGGNQTAMTDRQGRYSFSDVPPGAFSLNASYQGLNLGGHTRTTIAKNGEAVAANIVLGPSATVTGTVREPNGSVPAPHARVVLSNGLSATADAWGNYTLNFVPLGSYSLTTTEGARQGGGPVTLGAENEILSLDLALNRSHTPVTTTLNFTIANPNAATALSEIAFSNHLPDGLILAPGGVSGDCGGPLKSAAKATADPGSQDIQVSGVTLVGGASCNLSVNVAGSRPGSHTNATAPISSLESGRGASSNTAPLIVVAPPSISKSFSAPTVPLNGSVTMTFTITNPNGATDLTGVSFNDNLPSGMIIANPDSLTGVCDPGVITPSVSNINLVGATILAGSSCTFSIDVLALSGGTLINTTDPVTSNEGGTGNTATASVTVALPDLSITKTHTGNFLQGQFGATYTITVTNVGGATSNAAVTVTDVLPAGLTPTAIGGIGWTCTSLTSCTRIDGLDPGLSFNDITITVNVSLKAAATLTNTATVSGGGEANTTNDTASDVTTVTQIPGGALSIALVTNSSVTIDHGNTASFLFTVTSGSTSVGPVQFQCSGLPAPGTCTFTNQGETQSTAQITMTVTTATEASASNHGIWKTLPVVAIVILPFLGARKRSGRKAIAAIFLGVMIFLAGCGVAPKLTFVPRGSFPITVTATSSADPTVQASTTVTLVIR